MRGPGSRGGTSKSTFYRAWREAQLRRFQPSIPPQMPSTSPPRHDRNDTLRPRSPLRSARELRGLTPSELGRMIGVSGLHILQFENGTRRIRASDSLALAQILDARWLIVEEPATPCPESDKLAVFRRRLLRLVQIRACVGCPSSDASTDRVL
ncbi:MAG: hypothetical protein CMP81_05905 [Fulvimarina sp.]|nr:hypothetical protein [Fulvimarina sp.]